MKPHRCFVWGVAGLVAFVVTPMFYGAVITTAYPPYPVPPASSYVSPDYSSPTSIGGSASNAVMVALNAQSLTLKELLQEHQKRVAESTQKGENERAKWEAELVTELQEKLGQVQKSMEQASKAGPGIVQVGNGQADDELVFLSALEGRVAQIQQELSVAVASSRDLSMQLMTNKGPESIAISSALSDNQRFVSQLQKEQLDLELRKLEFRALQKSARAATTNRHE